MDLLIQIKLTQPYRGIHWIPNVTENRTYPLGGGRGCWVSLATINCMGTTKSHQSPKASLLPVHLVLIIWPKISQGGGPLD